MQLFIFLCLSNYFDSDECCFLKCKHFSKLTNVFGYLEINYKLGIIRVLILQTEQLLVFAKEHITKSCPKNPKWVNCQPVSSLSLTSRITSKCQKSMLVRKIWVPLVSVCLSSKNEGEFISLKSTGFFFSEESKNQRPSRPDFPWWIEYAYFLCAL